MPHSTVFCRKRRREASLLRFFRSIRNNLQCGGAAKFEINVVDVYEHTGFNNPHHPRFISAAGEAVRDIAKAVEQTPGGAPAVVLKLRYEYCAVAEGIDEYTSVHSRYNVL